MFICRQTKEKKERILSNKNNDLVRELSKKLVSGDKKEVSETKEKKQKNIIRVGSNPFKKKNVVKENLHIQSQKKGMLTFDEESDSDHL